MKNKIFRILTITFLLLSMLFSIACTGEKGDKGEVGPQGEQGLPGLDGKDGKDYTEELYMGPYYTKIDENFIKNNSYSAPETWTGITTSACKLVITKMVRKNSVIKINNPDGKYIYGIMETNAPTVTNPYSGEINKAYIRGIDSGWLEGTQIEYKVGKLAEGNNLLCPEYTYVVINAWNSQKQGDVGRTEQERNEIFSRVSIDGYYYGRDDLPSDMTTLFRIEDENVKSVSHRGYFVNYVENTIPAYVESANLGYKYVEADVSFTKDGVAVLLHDETVDRVASYDKEGKNPVTGAIEIGNLTYAEVSSLYINRSGNTYYPKAAEERITLFSDFILLCKNLGLHPYIELKGASAVQKELLTANKIKSLIDMVRSCGMIDNVTWISFEAGGVESGDEAYSGGLKTVVLNEPTARVGWLGGTIDAQAITTANTLSTGKNEVFFDRDYSYVSAEGVRLAKQAGIPLEVYGVYNESILFGLDPYVSGTTVDGFFNSASVLARAMGLTTGVPLKK